MSSYLNKVQLIGRLGRDPDIRHDKNANKIVAISIATSEYWFDKITNEKREKTEWHKVVIYNERLANLADTYLKKGSYVYLEGTLQTREWIDLNGTKHLTTEIILPKFRGELLMLGSAPNQENQNQGFHSERDLDSSFNKKVDYDREGEKDDIPLDDEIPF